MLSLKSDQCVYTPFYCEENIFKLAESLPKEERERSYVVFISNGREMTPLWQQRVGPADKDHMVCWDYHVILIHRPPTSASMVYDLDTILPFPVSFIKYYQSVFRPGTLSENFVQQFRVIPTDDYLKTFSSDRSRMIKPDGTYREPPPTYACIQNGKDKNNLNAFISMDSRFKCGQILNLSQLYKTFA